MTPEQATEILRLKDANVAPKQIARKVGLRPAEVTAFIRGQAESAYLEKAKAGTLQPLYECITNRSTAKSLLEGRGADEDVRSGGLGQVIVARQEHNRLLMGSYLVDYWCLGVKDAIPPRKLSRSDYQMLKDSSAERFGEPFVEISLDQARSIVFGAASYARRLGFEPHQDFNAKAQAHLGGEPETLMPLEFGKDGQPFYMSGPYDNAEKIIQTLKRSVGEDNFKFIAGLEGAGSFLDFPE